MMKAGIFLLKRSTINLKPSTLNLQPSTSTFPSPPLHMNYFCAALSALGKLVPVLKLIGTLLPAGDTLT